MTNKWPLALCYTRALVNHVNVDDIPYILKDNMCRIIHCRLAGCFKINVISKYGGPRNSPLNGSSCRYDLGWLDSFIDKSLNVIVWVFRKVIWGVISCMAFDSLRRFLIVPAR